MKATYDFERNEAIIQKYLTSQELDILQLSDGNYICNIRALHDYLIITAAIFAGDKEGRLKLHDTVFNHGLSYQIRHVSWETGKSSSGKEVSRQTVQATCRARYY